MCAEPCSDEEPVGECPDCGMDVDIDGDAVDICAHSPIECETCGSAPCDQSC